MSARGRRCSSSESSYQLRLHRGATESFPIVERLVHGALEEHRLYLLDPAGRALPLLPLAVCGYDEKTDRHDLFLPRILATKPGAKVELLGILTGSKRKQTV